MTNTKTAKINMLEGPLFSSIIRYTVPIILTSLLQLLFNAADLIVVGRYCGEVSVAAVGNCGSITNLIVNLFIGLSVGTGVTVAHALGANKPDTVHRLIHTALPTAIVSGFVVMIIGVRFAKNFLQLMNTPDTVLPLSTIYMRIYFAGAVFIMVYNFCASILRAAGDTRSPLIYLSIAGIINIILNIIFVTLFNMNVAGVALATTISQGVSAVLVVRALMRRTDACKLILSKMRFYKAQLFDILRIGLPAGLQSSLFSISNVIIQSSINSFGDILMSGNAAASNIEGFVYVILNAFHQSALNFTGRNVGARQYKRVAKVFRICLACVIAAGAIFSTIACLLGPFLLSIYIPDSKEAVSWGMIRLCYICIPYFLCGMMDVSTGVLRGMGASIIPMIISVIGVCGIRICWIYTIFQIPQYHTPQCLYFSYTISWSATFICQMIAFLIIYHKQTRQIQTN